MSKEVINKTRPEWAVVSQGTALGTSSIIDTSAFNTMVLYCIHGGTGGSRALGVYANAGTTPGTAATTFPDKILIGTNNSDQAGLGDPVWAVGSLTDQAIIAYGTSTDSSFSLSYVMHD